jgi:cell division topological specificity factor
MSVFNLFRRRGSAPIARERLKILLSHERTSHGQSDLLANLRDEILAVVAKHVNVEHDQVHVTMDRGNSVSRLEINVEVPHSTGALAAAEEEKPRRARLSKSTNPFVSVQG